MTRDDSCLVRISKATRDRLKAEAIRLIEAHDHGHTSKDIRTPNNHPSHVGASLDAIIMMLLDERENHRQRRRKAKGE